MINKFNGLCEWVRDVRWKISAMGDYQQLGKDNRNHATTARRKKIFSRKTKGLAV